MLRVNRNRVYDDNTLLAIWDNDQEATDWAGWLEVVERNREIRRPVYCMPTPWLTEAGIARLERLLRSMGGRPLVGGFPRNRWWTVDWDRLDDRHYVAVVYEDGSQQPYRLWWGESLYTLFKDTYYSSAIKELHTWERLPAGNWLKVVWHKSPKKADWAPVAQHVIDNLVK